jgi:hypothetical protein
MPSLKLPLKEMKIISCKPTSLNVIFRSIRRSKAPSVEIIWKWDSALTATSVSLLMGLHSCELTWILTNLTRQKFVIASSLKVNVAMEADVIFYI